jgi:hypothetical protein
MSSWTDIDTIIAVVNTQLLPAPQLAIDLIPSSAKFIEHLYSILALDAATRMGFL